MRDYNKHLQLIFVIIVGFQTTINAQLFKKSKLYNVVFVIQNDYTEYSNDFTSILSALPSDKKTKCSSFAFKRTDNETERTYYNLPITYESNFFIQKSNTNKCSSKSFTDWYNCFLNQSSSIDLGKAKIYVLDKSKEQRISVNIPTYKSVTDLATEIKNSGRAFLDEKNFIVIFVYFGDNPCDKYKLSSLRPAPAIYVSTEFVNRPINYRGFQCYDIKWSLLDNFDNYEIYFFGETDRLGDEPIKYEVDIKTNDRILIDNDTIHYYLKESDLGNICYEKYRDRNTPKDDCPDCRFECIYKRQWYIQIKGKNIECDVETFDSKIGPLLLQCIGKN